MELTEELGNISEACRRSKMSLRSFYVWRHRYQTSGLEGLKRRCTIIGKNPTAITSENGATVFKTRMLHPSWGCDKISAKLKQQGIKISPVSVRRVLVFNKTSNVTSRRILLEKMHQEEGYSLTEEQLALIKKYNPDFEPIY